MSSVTTVTVRLVGSKTLKHAVAIDCSSEDLIGEVKKVLGKREECRYPSDELVFFIDGQELHNETQLSSLLPVDKAVTLISIQVEPVGRMTLAQELDLDGADLFADGGSPKHSSKDSGSKESYGEDDMEDEVPHGRRATILHANSDSATLDHVILDEETAVGHSPMDSDSMERSPLIRMGSEVASHFKPEAGMTHPTDPQLSQVWEEEMAEQRAHRDSIELEEAGGTGSGGVQTMVLTEEALAVMNGTSSRNVEELATVDVQQMRGKESSDDASDMPSMLAAISGKEALSVHPARDPDTIDDGVSPKRIGYDEQMRQFSGLNTSMQVLPSHSASDLKKKGSPTVPMAGVVDGSLSRSVMSQNSAGKSHNSELSREREKTEQFKWTLVYVGAGFAAAVLIGAAVMIYRARNGGASSTQRRLNPSSEVRDFASVQRPRRKHVS